MTDLFEMWLTDESPHEHRYYNKMKQRTPEWFSVRRNRISASEAGAALGLSPFKSPARLLAEKVDPSIRHYEDTPSTAWGKLHEDEAISAFLEENDHAYNEVGYITCGTWLGASPDGLLDDDGLIEIKTPYNMKRELRSVFTQPYYYMQVQVQLLCSDRQWCAFYQWRPHDQMLEIVPRNRDILVDAVPRLRKFWEEVQVQKGLKK